MRHRKLSGKLGRNTSHRRCMTANMVKSLIEHGRIETTVPKAKEIRRHADRLVTLAKQGTLASRRRAIGLLMIRYNALTAKQERQARQGDLSAYNADRGVIKTLFDDVGPRFKERQGGYTRIVRTDTRTGDGADRCILEFVS